MPPRARPASRPGIAPESLEARSQPVLGIALPTSFRFLERDTVTPAPGQNIPAPAKPPAPDPLGSEAIPVRVRTPANILALTTYSAQQNNPYKMAVDPMPLVPDPYPNPDSDIVERPIVSHSLARIFILQLLKRLQTAQRSTDNVPVTIPMHETGHDGSADLPRVSRKRGPSRERMRLTCELMRDRLWLMEEQLENLISDLEEVQLKEDDEK